MSHSDSYKILCLNYKFNYWGNNEKGNQCPTSFSTSGLDKHKSIGIYENMILYYARDIVDRHRRVTSTFLLWLVLFLFDYKFFFNLK